MTLHREHTDASHQDIPTPGHIRVRKAHHFEHGPTAAPGGQKRFTTTPDGPTWLKRGPQKEHVHANPHQ